MRRASRKPFDLRLKIAIIESRRTQRRAAFETRIGETRFSEIVGRRGTPPSDEEKQKIARYLNRAISDLFDPEPPEDDPPVLTQPDAKGAA